MLILYGSVTYPATHNDHRGNRESCPYGMTRGGGLWWIHCGGYLDQAGITVFKDP